jgi:hypothetical protein
MAAQQNQPQKAASLRDEKAADQAQRLGKGHDADGPRPLCPIDVVDGIPDRAAKPAKWKYILIALIFLAWVAFLLYCLLSGNINK